MSRLFLDKKTIWLLDEPYVFIDEQNTIDLSNKILDSNLRLETVNSLKDELGGIYRKDQQKN